MSFLLIPVSLADANAFVERLHRHHKKVQGHKFSLGAAIQCSHCESTGTIFEMMVGLSIPCPKCGGKGSKVVGVAIVGRPVSRIRDDGRTLEVTRLCTDGTRNACSYLYAAARRAASALGYKRIGTYLLSGEDGASVKAAGWQWVSHTTGRSWTCPSRPRVDKHPTVDKELYEAVA